MMKLKLEQERLFIIFKKYRCFYLISVFVFGVGGYLFTKLSEKKYRVQATVLIRSNEQYDRSLAPVEIQQEFYSERIAEGFRNELVYLTSYKNIESVLKRMNKQVDYFAKETRFGIPREIWGNTPFVVEVQNEHVQVVEMVFNIRRQDDNLIIEAEGDRVSLFNVNDWSKLGEIEGYEFKEVFNFGVPITTPYFSFVIKEDSISNINWDIDYSFKINNFYKQVDYYKKQLQVNILGIDITAAEVYIDTNIPEKGVLFLKYLLDEYLRQDVEKKNSLAQGTIDYIDYQIAMVEDSLDMAESVLKSFKASERLTDITIQNQQRLQFISDLEREKADLNFSLQYYRILNDQLKDNVFEDFVLPSQGNVEDQVLVHLISSTMELLSRRKGMETGDGNEKNIFIEEIDDEIEAYVNNIRNHIKSKVGRIELGISDITLRIDDVRSELSRVPEKEIRLAQFERKFNLEDELYSYLLRKRAEAEMAKKSNLSNKEIVNPARLISDDPVYPMKKVNYALSVLIGLLIPSFFVFKDFVYDKRLFLISELEDNVSYNILGRVTCLRKNGGGTVENTSFEESLRYMKYNFDLKISGLPNKVIGFTSSISGEGKTFVSGHFAKIVAACGKDVVYIDMDYRKASVNRRISNERGGFYDVIGGKYQLDEVIDKEDKLHYISPGLGFHLSILGDKGQQLLNSVFEELKKEYDYIIMDYPPIGLVSDYLQLIKYINLVAFVARLGHSDLDVMGKVLDNLEFHAEKQKIVLVLNGLKDSGKYYGRYGGKKKYFAR